MNSRTTLFRRVAFASVIALGVAACGDNVVTVPPTPALTVSPNSLQIQPGQSGQFSVSITGTDNTAFTVSHSGAVSSTEVNGNVVSVTVAAGATPGQTGSVNVQASGHPSLAATVQVVVSGTIIPPGDDAEVTIRSITQANTLTPVNPAAVQGLIDVTLAVTRGDASALEVALVGANDERFVIEQCSQTFGTTGSAADGLITASDLRATANADIVCTINTAAASEAGVPAFPNAGYRISARLLRGQDVLDSATSAQLTFANVDRVDLEVSPATSAISPATGLEWHTGGVTVRAVPVSFSGASVARVTFNANLLNGGTVQRTDDNPDGGFAVTFPTSGSNSIPAVTDSIRFSVSSVTTAGSVGPGIPDSLGTVVRYDRVAPTGGAEPTFTNQWINAATEINAATNWTDPGVGGVTRTFFYSTNTAQNANQIVDGGQQLPTDRGAIESDVSNAYALAVRVCDALNNCRNELVGTFGVDVTPPTITILQPSPANMAVNPVNNYTFLVEDTRSGPAANQLRVRAILSGPGISGQDTCAIGNWANNACGHVNINGPIALPGDEGYYSLTVQGRDAAGNLTTTTITRLALRDVTPPSVSNVAIPASLQGGQPATFTAVATDNLDLGRASFRLDFGGVIELPLQADQTLGTFGEPWITQANLSSTAPFIRAVETATGGTPDGSFQVATAARFRVWDLANNTATQANDFAAGTVTRPGTAIASFSALGVNSFAMNTANTTIWRNPTGNQAASATLRARAQGPTGTFGNPFSRVTFYRTIGGIHHPIGDASATASDDGTTRTWTYTGPVITGSNFAVGPLTYFAVGYTNDGDALVSEAQVITVDEN